MWAILISSLMKFAVPLGLFVWSLLQPTIASYVFVGLAALFVGYIFFIDIANRPKPDPLLWTPGEIKALQDYHLALRFSFGAKDFSCYLNGIRLSSLIWVTWLLWNHFWIPAGLLVVFFLSPRHCRSDLTRSFSCLMLLEEDSTGLQKSSLCCSKCKKN